MAYRNLQASRFKEIIAGKKFTIFFNNLFRVLKMKVDRARTLKYRSWSRHFITAFIQQIELWRTKK